MSNYNGYTLANGDRVSQAVSYSELFSAQLTKDLFEPGSEKNNTVYKLQQAVKQGLSKFDADCSESLLERIQLGLLESPFSPNNIKAYCKKCFE